MNTTGNDSWTGNSSTHIDGTNIGPKATIQNGTDTVDHGGTVYVADGTYNEHITINQNLTLIGQSLAGTIIDGTQNGRPLTINSGLYVTITNFTITNGNITGGDVFGGGIYNSGKLTMTNCNITNNTATATGNSVSANGGGICNRGILTMTNCNIENNTATSSSNFGTVFSDGGGIYNYGGTLTMTNCNIQNNTATANAGSSSACGGGIYNYGGTLTITNCNIQNNTAISKMAFDFGGGIYNSGDLTVNFSRIVSNNPQAIYTAGKTSLEDNWWGSNVPDFTSLIKGAASPHDWLYMTINATPTTINNTQTSLITVSFNNYSNGTTYTAYTPLSGQYIPDGSPINFQTDLGSIGCKSIDKTTVGGIATATLTASELAGTAHIIATTDSQPVYSNVLINPKSSVYLNITPDKTNPVVGDTVTYRLKVGNYGPDPAENVVMTFTVPQGLVFAGATDNIGEKWSYDANTRTITWNLGTVPKGDPDLWASFVYAAAGDYLINPLLSTSTYDPDLNTNTQSIRVLATTSPSPTSANTATTAPSVNAATGNTVGMQTTGAPLAPLVIGILSVLGGLITTRKKQ
ncbi:hypothetical protein [uncultured Methanobacterium sp.]|uniref:hypothetical protein n=1 Tax=uncultured Methanobacterium sp. TaxID=176306 RepID=UPI002AA5FE15|nr:hypothetical protein [uncultured Methanobacterium sp.]